MRVLYPHQRDAMRYAVREDHPALFAEMRLGKTVIPIRRSQAYRPRAEHLRALVVGPNSVLGSWEDELNVEGERDVTYLHGPRRQRAKRLIEDHTWCLINKEGWQVLPEIAQVPWDIVICDESTFIKNPQAQVTKFFLSNFRDVPHRWALAGQPAPESELDLWCQLAWLDGGAFGYTSFWQFRASCFDPDVNGWSWAPKRGLSKMIRTYMKERAFVLSRRDAGYFTKTVRERRRIEMPADLQRTYRKAEREFVLEYRGRKKATTKYAMTRWQWMRSACGGFVDGKLVWPGKVNALIELLTGELKDEQVVVWFAYNQEIVACANALDRVGVNVAAIMGEVKPETRRVLVRAFSRGKLRVLLLQELVAQFGMNLAAADTAIYYSNHPGHLARVQSGDRIVSLQKQTPLLYIDLVVARTVDEDVADLVIGKKWRSELLLRGAAAERMGRRHANRTA